MFSSIRTKLTILHVAILAVFIIAIAAVAYYAVLRGMDRDLNTRLAEMSSNFATALAAEQEDQKDNTSSGDAITETLSEMRFRDYQFAVYSRDEKLLGSTADFELPLDRGEGPGQFRDINNGSRAFRVYRTSIKAGGETLQLLAVHSLDEKAAMQSELGRIFVVGIPLTLILAAFSGYFLARRSLAPMLEMGKQADRISARNLNERLAVKNKQDELGQLGGVFNDMLARLDRAFRQQQQFMADASHELRTPLAIIRGESEVALSKHDRRTGEYRESLSIVHDESKRLTKIVEDLFTLARADAGQFRAKLAPVYIDEIVGDAARAIGVLAREKDVTIDVVMNDEMLMNADEALIRRLFLNLLDNAVKYNHSGGSVSIRSDITNRNYTFLITDSGPGIPDEEQPHIFDRFYRIDKSRSRSQTLETSGSGLGLAIAQWIAEMHGGRVELLSSTDQGSVFAVTLPR